MQFEFYGRLYSKPLHPNLDAIWHKRYFYQILISDFGNKIHVLKETSWEYLQCTKVALNYNIDYETLEMRFSFWEWNKNKIEVHFFPQSMSMTK